MTTATTTTTSSTTSNPYQSLYDALCHGQINFPTMLHKLQTTLPINIIQYWQIVMNEFERKRYDHVMELIDRLQLLGKDGNNNNNISQLVQQAGERGQFGICLRYVKKTSIPITSIVKMMIHQNQIELALKTIYEYQLGREFKIPVLISVLLDQGSFASAQKFISKDPDLERLFPPETIVERMIVAMQWDSALSLVSVTPKLKSMPEYSTASLIRRMIQARDWLSTLKSLSFWGVPLSVTTKSALQDIHVEMLRLMIKGLIEDKKLFLAMRKICEYHFDDEFIPRDLVKTMIVEGQSHHALRFIRLWKLDDEFISEITTMKKSRMRALGEFRRVAKELTKIRNNQMVGNQQQKNNFVLTPLSTSSNANNEMIEVLIARVPLITLSESKMFHHYTRSRRNSQEEGLDDKNMKKEFSAMMDSPFDEGKNNVNNNHTNGNNGDDEEDEILMPKQQQQQQRPPPPTSVINNMEQPKQLPLPVFMPYQHPPRHFQPPPNNMQPIPPLPLIQPMMMQQQQQQQQHGYFPPPPQQQQQLPPHQQQQQFGPPPPSNFIPMMHPHPQQMGMMGSPFPPLPIPPHQQQFPPHQQQFPPALIHQQQQFPNPGNMMPPPQQQQLQQQMMMNRGQFPPQPINNNNNGMPPPAMLSVSMFPPLSVALNQEMNNQLPLMSPLVPQNGEQQQQLLKRRTSAPLKPSQIYFKPQQQQQQQQQSVVSAPSTSSSDDQHNTIASQ
jgi:hypothetical protein